MPRKRRKWELYADMVLFVRGDAAIYRHSHKNILAPSKVLLRQDESSPKKPFILETGNHRKTDTSGADST